MVDIASALTIASSTLELVKQLRSLDHDLDKAELKGAMVELYGNLADVKMALVDAEQLLHGKDAEIESLHSQMTFEKTLIESNGFKYDVVDGGPDGMPFCPKCEIDGHGFFRIVKTGHSNHDPRVCPKCRMDYGVAASNYRNGRRAS